MRGNKTAMFKIDFESKKTRAAIRYFTYGVMTLSVLGISALAVLFTLGYRLDKAGSFDQGGLVQFRTLPSGAIVRVDGKRTATTPAKATLSAGAHDISMQRSGYREWTKQINIAAGQLLWLDYARLIPNSVTTTTVQAFDKLDSLQFSPDRKWALLLPEAGQPSVVLADLRDSEKPALQTLTLPAGSWTASPDPHSFILQEWNIGSRYMLIKHTYGTTTEFLRFDREQPDKVINLSRTLGQLSLAHFAGDNPAIIYGILGGQLQQYDTNNANNTKTFATAIVNDFVVYRDNRLAIVGERDGKRIVSYIVNGVETIVQTYEPTTGVLIALNNYFNDDYLAVAVGDQISIYRSPKDVGTTLPAKVFADFQIKDGAGAVQWLSFSGNGRLLVAQSGATYTTYDLELSRQTTTTVGVAAQQRFYWLDDYTLAIDVDNVLRLREFDGANQQDISSVVSGYRVSLSEDGNYIYSIGRDGQNKLLLQRSQIVLP